MKTNEFEGVGTVIPKGWKEVHLSSLIYFGEAGISVNSEDRQRQPGELGILKTSAVTYGRFDPLEHKTVLKSEEDKVTAKPKKDCILVSRMNTLEMVGASVYVDQDYEDLFLPDRLWQAERKSQNCSMKWLSYVLASPEMRAKISNIATGTSGSMKNITKPGFLTLQVLLPPLPEQRAIAAILGTWDRAITLTERRLAAAEQRKQALMQQLLTGRVRFPEFAGEAWHEVKFSQILDIEIGRTPSRNKPEYWDPQKETKNVWLSIADLAGKYIVDSSEYISEEGVKSCHCRLVPAGTVVMSFKLTIGRAAILAIPAFTNEAICSLIPKDAQILLNDYLYHALSIVNFDQQIDQAVKGKTLNKAKLARLELQLPSIPEQRRIAAVLNACDREIDLLRRKRDALQQQKQGLMQRLLTGRVRVPPLSPPQRGGSSDLPPSGGD